MFTPEECDLYPLDTDCAPPTTGFPGTTTTLVERDTPPELPDTGSSIGPLALSGLALLVFGILLVYKAEFTSRTDRIFLIITAFIVPIIILGIVIVNYL